MDLGFIIFTFFKRSSQQRCMVYPGFVRRRGFFWVGLQKKIHKMDQKFVYIHVRNFFVSRTAIYKGRGVSTR